MKPRHSCILTSILTYLHKGVSIRQYEILPFYTKIQGDHNSSGLFTFTSKYINGLYLKTSYVNGGDYISPNPARDKIVINGIDNSCTYIIYDAMGKISKVGILDYPYHIKVAQLLHGTYILKVITDDSYSFVKFLKQ